MNELMLSTISRKGRSESVVTDSQGVVIRKKTIITDHPIGEILSVITPVEVRRTWLSVFCDLAAPAFQYKHPNGQTVVRRDKQKEGLKRFLAMGWNERQWEAVKACWSEELFDSWFKGTLKKETARIADELTAWSLIENKLDKDDMGKETRGMKYLCEVFPWNPETRKRQYIIVNDDGPLDIKNYEGQNETTNEVSPGVWEHKVTGKAYIDWFNDLGLTDAKKNAIADNSVDVYPDYSEIITKSLIKKVVV